MALADFQAAVVPARDLAALTERLKGEAVADLVPSVNYAENDVASFWYKPEASNENIEIDAVARYVSDALVLWFEDGARVNDNQIAEAAAELEGPLLGDIRAFFGSEPQPGIDGDDRLHILHLRDVGGNVAGYFSAADQFPSNVNPFSNQRELLYINLRQVRLASDIYYGVVAHEFQHLIHVGNDLNETAWVDEGMAELAAYLVGYGDIDHVSQFGKLTDIQLNNFDYVNDVSGHYAASFLFTAYLLDRFGVDAMKTLIGSAENGLTGYESVVDLTRDELFADWAVANYLAGAGINDPIFGYEDIEPPSIEPAATYRRFPAEGEGAVSQFGADYLRVRSRDPLQLSLVASRQLPVLPLPAPADGQFFVSTVPNDRSDVMLSRRFDLSGVASATLSFDTWYQIEEDWDYGYVMASTDDGVSWTLLETANTTTTNPQGNSYGPALTGHSDGWVTLAADLTPFVGQEVLVRFEYITDDAVHEPGWAVDNIAIEAIDYVETFEAATDWTFEGWVRHANVLPQQAVVRALYLGRDGTHRVETLPLQDDQTGSFELALNETIDEVVIMIGGVTPISAEKMAYRYTIEELP